MSIPQKTLWDNTFQKRYQYEGLRPTVFSQYLQNFVITEVYKEHSAFPKIPQNNKGDTISLCTMSTYK